MLRKIMNAKQTPPVFVLIAVTSALLLQHALGWLPCPLCILQRLTAIGLMVSLIVAAGPGRPHEKLALAAAGVFSLLGLLAGGAHLQLLAEPSIGACGPGLSRYVSNLMDYIPGSTWLLEGAGACDDARYQILGIPLPAYSMAVHLLAFALAVRVAVKPRG